MSQPPAPDQEEEWRLEVEIRDEKGESISGRVYVTDAKGDLLTALDTEPPAPLAQSVRGAVSVIAYAWHYVPLYFDNLTRPSSGVRTIIAQVERGAGISGMVVDEAGKPAIARVGRVRARPLDPPPWLWRRAASWSSQTDETGRWFVFESLAEDDASFRLQGLPPGRYEIDCDRPRPRHGEPEGGTLLAPEPVVASVGDSDIRLVCPRAVTVRVRFVDLDTGATPPGHPSARWEADRGDESTWSGWGFVDADGLALDVPPGASFTFSAEVEGYLVPEPVRIVANREPGEQAINIGLRRDAGAVAELTLVVRDETGLPAFPLMVGRRRRSVRYEPEDGRYVLQVPAGKHKVELQSPGDQILLFKREWIPAMHNPDDFPAARAYLPQEMEIELPRGGRVTREITVQRAALIWVRREAESTRPRARTLEEAVEDSVRLFKGGKEIEGAFRRLYEDKGLVAAVEPGDYMVQGPVGAEIVRAEVVAKATEVAEVWLRAGSAK